MRQQTLKEYQSGAEEWGTGDCPACDFSATLAGVKRHYTVHGEKYNTAWLRHRYGVPPSWLLNTLHNVLNKSVKRISEELSISRYWIQKYMDENGIGKRGRSEAESLKWEQMSEEQRTEQVAAAHQKSRELAESGDLSLQKWRRENPKKATEMSARNARNMSEVRERNGMKGATGRDSPTWRGGYSHKQTVRDLLPGTSFYTQRKEVLERDNYTCQMCGRHEGEIGREPDVHHIVPVLCGGTNATELMISLCPSCHTTAEHRTYDFTDPLLVETFGR